jgi:hypothetical protein
MKDSKKLEQMYEAYLRDNLSNMDREEMIETFITTVLKFMDFTQPHVKEQVVKILVRYEEKKKKEGKTREEPEAEVKEELDFTSMYKPSDFDDLLQHLTLISSSHSDVIDLEDIMNATSAAASLRKYMFDMEVPWVGLIDDLLCFSWGSDVTNSMLTIFNGGITQLEFTHKEEVYELEFTEEGELEEAGILRILAEGYELGN